MYRFGGRMNNGGYQNTRNNGVYQPPNQRYQYHDQPNQRDPANNDAITELVQKLESWKKEQKVFNQAHSATVRNLEVQMSHLVNQINARPSGLLPSDTKDPTKAHVNALTTRSGK